MKRDDITQKMHDVVDIVARTPVPAATTINISDLADLLIAAERLHQVEQLFDEWTKHGEAGNAHYADRARELGQLIGR